MLKHITFTGADDSIDPYDLARLTLKHKNISIEWGILLSPSTSGSSRYPSIRWVQELNKVWYKTGCLHLSAHLCTKYIRNLYNGKPLSTMYTPICSMFERVQLNFGRKDVQNKLINPYLFSLLDLKHPEYIFQLDGVNDELFRSCHNQMSAMGYSVVGLFDSSCGTGKKIDTLNDPYNNYFVGYAGGIDSENIASIISTLNTKLGDQPYWIDMETSLRSKVFDNGHLDIFDLDKVEQCLQVAKEVNHE